MVKSISSKPLTEMAIPVRILLKKFHLVSNFNRASANVLSFSSSIFTFWIWLFKGIWIAIVIPCTPKNRQHQLELLTKFLSVQQLAMKPIL